MVNYTQYLEKIIGLAHAHGVTARFVDVMPKSIRPTPVRGAFRMGEVLLPKDNAEEALFVLLHGLGHMAQWTEYPEEQKQSYSYNSKGDTWDEVSLRKIWHHEWSALPYVLGFLKEHHLGVLRDWYTRYFIADQYYLAEIFRENEYDLQKFYTTLSEVKGEGVKEAYVPAMFPTLNLELNQKGYICVV